MARIILTLPKMLLLGIVAISAIVSMYGATNAIAVYSDHSVFVSGLMMVAAAVLVNPLFCFIANYGLMHYADVPLGVALTLTLPACLAWCFVLGRSLIAAPPRRPTG